MIKYLKKIQNKNGSFSNSKNKESIFFTCLILSCLNKVKGNKDIKEIKKKIFNFLISKKGEKGIFSDDLGINFSVLSSLIEYDSEIADGKLIANFLNLLISYEKKEGGPYYSKKQKKEIDLFVNSQIGYFLSLLEVDLPNIFDLIENSIISQNFKSSYFTNSYFPIYIISKLYNEKNKKKIIEYILENKGNNVLEDSLSIISLFNLGCPFSKMSHLIDKFKKYSENDLKKSYLFGESKILSEESKSNFALNISFYLEAIECLNNLNKREKNKKERGVKEEEEEREREKEEDREKEKKEEKREEKKKIQGLKEEKEMFERIINIAKKRFSLFKGDIKKFAWQEIEKTIKRNTDKQMSLMAYYFKKSLGKKGEGISDEIIAQMGLANIFYWTAFIIYDDFWDEDEEANPKILPTANFYSREFLFFFYSLFKDDSFNIFIRNLMDKLDQANTWETIYCRIKKKGNKIFIPEKFPNFKDYTIKYEPASAHILGPIAILKMMDYNENSFEAKNLIKYFKNYLITKQFNDDLHDWQEDLQRGHLSTAVSELLKSFSKKYPNHKIIDMKKDLEKLQEIYWFDTLPRLCKISLIHSKRSRNALNKLDILEDKLYLEQFIDLPEKCIKDALKEQKKTIDFLKSYRK